VRHEEDEPEGVDDEAAKGVPYLVGAIVLLPLA
jgi:hypothetical protein